MKNPNLALGFIFITVLLDSIGFGIIMPVMPQLIMVVTNEPISSAAIYGGWLMFLYALMQFFFAPVMGNLSDRFGRRPVLLLSLLAFGLNYLMMGWAPTLAWLVAGRLIAGCASSTYAIANAYIADVFPPEQRAKNFALMGAAFGGGFILGPVLGGFLGELGPRVPFYATAVLALVNAVFGFLVLPETLAPENRRPFDWRRANPLGAFAHLRQYPLVGRLVFGLFFFLVAHQSLPAVWSYFTIARFDWSESQIGFSLGFVGVLMMLTQAFLIRWVIDRWGAVTTAYMGLTCAGLSFLGYAFVTEAWMVYVFLLVGAAQGFVGPAVQGVMSARVPSNAQGELQGSLASASSLAAIIAPLLMTQLFGYFTGASAPLYFPGVSYFLAATLVVVSTLILIPGMRRATR
ncbi:MFS transporter [Halieaceae bacterium IMCC14734]|uniref:MFS transporter n=1 Tax=Candidatus Litorirhabdus singularis TaxID=2518993 RepID=A0ABT3TLC6_9GAMM|nr:MFS transporter [Candidatus Litorirhabdus singularis]